MSVGNREMAVDTTVREVLKSTLLLKQKKYIAMVSLIVTGLVLGRCKARRAKSAC